MFVLTEKEHPRLCLVPQNWLNSQFSRKYKCWFWTQIWLIQHYEAFFAIYWCDIYNNYEQGRLFKVLEFNKNDNELINLQEWLEVVWKGKLNRVVSIGCQSDIDWAIKSLAKIAPSRQRSATTQRPKVIRSDHSTASKIQANLALNRTQRKKCH